MNFVNLIYEIKYRDKIYTFLSQYILNKYHYYYYYLLFFLKKFTYHLF